MPKSMATTPHSFLTIFNASQPLQCLKNFQGLKVTPLLNRRQQVCIARVQDEWISKCQIRAESPPIESVHKIMLTQILLEWLLFIMK